MLNIIIQEGYSVVYIHAALCICLLGHSVCLLVYTLQNATSKSYFSCTASTVTLLHFQLTKHLHVNSYGENQHNDTWALP